MTPELVTPDTPTKKKLIKNIVTKRPQITDREIGSVLTDIHKLFAACQKIIVEPQWRISITERRRKGKVTKRRIITVDLETFKKVKPNDAKSLKDIFKSVSDLDKNEAK